MFTIGEIKEAISKIEDTEIINNDEEKNENSFKFKKNGDTFIINSFSMDMVSKTNLKLSRAIKIPTSWKITKEDAEFLCSTTNITNNTPCKIIYFYETIDDVLNNSFYITNVYNDKLDQFQKFASKELRDANLVVVILGMILEIAITTQEVIAGLEGPMNKKTDTGGINGN